MSFSSYFSFFILVDKGYKKQNCYIIFCLFVDFFHFCLACLDLQMKKMVQKILQPIFVFGNEKWDEKLNSQVFCSKRK